MAKDQRSDTLPPAQGKQRSHVYLSLLPERSIDSVSELRVEEE
jgi:hypothetical protein